MKTVNLVASISTINRWFPDHTHQFTSAICSADFPITPEKCQTKFGRWLAERICTTRFDDDLSTLVLVNSKTDADMVVHNMAENLKLQTFRTKSDMDRLLTRLRDWCEKQEKFDAVYGDSLYKHSSTTFHWPVFGSSAASNAQSPEEYFDKCAGLIRSMKPKRVYVFHSNEEVPESFGVTKYRHP